MVPGCWTDLSVKVVDQGRQSPHLVVFTCFASVGLHTGLDRKEMLLQAVGLRMLLNHIKSSLSVHS